MGILKTAKEQNTQALWLVMNNGAFGTIYGLQNLAYKRNIGTKFVCKSTNQDYSPDFAAVARACGIEGVRVEKPEELKPALERALNCNGPILLDVIMDGMSRFLQTGTGIFSIFTSISSVKTLIQSVNCQAH